MPRSSRVLGAARTFERYNHFLLDNPKLKIVFNDGRNFLTTTEKRFKRFDVITVMRINFDALSRYRESILPYPVPAPECRSREEQI